MKLIIDIPDNEIPKRREILSIYLRFIDGKVCECTYPFEEIDIPTGRWIADKCSICGKGIEDLIDSREWYRNETPNYCPFCGVRIEETEND